MKKKLLLLVSLMLSASLIACGNDTNTPEEKSPETNISSELEVPWDQIGIEPTDKVTVTYEDDKILSLCIEGVRCAEGAISP